MDVGGQCVRRATSGSGEIFSWLEEKSFLLLREKSNGTKMPARSSLRAPPGDETKPSRVLRDAAQSCRVGVRCHHSRNALGWVK